MKTVTQVPVLEFERGWGSKVDDYMICESVADAQKFIVEFNSKNTAKTVPDWYMIAENIITPIDITDEQYKHLMTGKNPGRMWKSTLRKLDK